MQTRGCSCTILFSNALAATKQTCPVACYVQCHVQLLHVKVNQLHILGDLTGTRACITYLEAEASPTNSSQPKVHQASAIQQLGGNIQHTSRICVHAFNDCDVCCVLLPSCCMA
jgi:hypothetical protein